MANRTMQAKALKLKRQLRRLPRRIDDPPGKFTEHSGTPIPTRMKAEGVKAPSRPQPELMKGYKHRAKSLEKEDKPKRYSGTPPGQKEAQDRRLQMMKERLDETDMETRRLLCVSKFLFNRQRG